MNQHWSDRLMLLPSSMHAALPLLPDHSTHLILFTRHSIRHAVDSEGRAGYGVQLSEEGRALALAWGDYLTAQTGRCIVHCMSSPIQRCLDTATLMLEGAAVHHAAATHRIEAQNLEGWSDIKDQHLTDQVVPQSLLVEPGSFVVDVRKIAHIFRDQGAVTFIDRFVKNQLEGMKHPIKGVRDILMLLFEADQRHTGHTMSGKLTLVVSHDTILAAVIAVISGHFRVQSDDWPQMMEGLFLWFEARSQVSIGDFENSILHWIWRGQHYQLALDQLQVD